MPTTTPNWGEPQTLSSFTSLPEPVPISKVKPKDKTKLNVCGHSGHDAYTIPIRYGRAQCLACQVVKTVEAKYTPGFKKPSFPTPIEQEIPQTVSIDDLLDYTSELLDEEDEEFHEDEPE